MKNITNIIFHESCVLPLKTDIAITYVTITQSAMRDILWADEKLTQDGSSTYAKTVFSEAVGAMKAATEMLLTIEGGKRDIYKASGKVIKIRLCRYGINPNSAKYF